MFRALRGRFGAGWQRWREKGLGGLFLFEFVVVMLGVLAAQGVQAAWEQRKERALADEAMEEYRRDLQDFANYGRYHQIVGNCYRETLWDVFRALGRGETPRTEDLAPPSGAVVWTRDWDDPTVRAVMRFYGDETVLEHDQHVYLSEEYRRLNAAIMQEWSSLRLLFEAAGPITATERGEIRLSLSRILTDLAKLNGQAGGMAQTLIERGYEPDPVKIQRYGSAPSCRHEVVAVVGAPDGFTPGPAEQARIDEAIARNEAKAKGGA